jgi:hypothetical protein
MTQSVLIKGCLEDYVTGEPLSGYLLAIYDKDLFLDDFLGIGVCNEKGCFRLEVYPFEFNQDIFEFEKYPDILLDIFCIEHFSGRIKKYVRNYPASQKPDSNVLQLGSIKINTDQYILVNKNPLTELERKSLKAKITSGMLEKFVSEMNIILANIGIIVVDNVQLCVADSEEDMRNKLHLAGNNAGIITNESWIEQISLITQLSPILYNPLDNKIYCSAGIPSNINTDMYKSLLLRELMYFHIFSQNEQCRGLMKIMRCALEPNDDQINILYGIESQIRTVWHKLVRNNYPFGTEFKTISLFQRMKILAKRVANKKQC